MCGDHSECVRSGEQGQCQATGYCSFPDRDCDSGQRYGKHASVALAGGCVDDVFDGIGSAGDDDGDDDSDTDGMSGGEDDGSTGVEEAIFDGTTGGDGGCFEDDFEDGLLDPFWCTLAPPGFQIVEAGGSLRVRLEPSSWEGGDALGEVSNCDAIPLLGTSASSVVEQVPSLGPHTEGYLELASDDLLFGIGVEEGDLYAYYDRPGPGVDYEGERHYDPALHRFWRVSGTDQGLVAEVSADGIAWTHLYTEPLSLHGIVGYARMGAWSERTPTEADSARFGSIELCAEPGAIEP